MKMAKVQNLRALVNQRLIIAAEEIFGLFERTIAEYEEEIDRQRRLLKPDINKTGLQQDVQKQNVSEEEQQEWSPRVDQNETQSPHIKEEQVEVWSSQVGEPLQGRWEADIAKFPFTRVPVKSENAEEKAESSHLHQSQTEETREAEPSSSRLAEEMKTETDGEACGGPESGTNLDLASYLQHTTDCRRPEMEKCHIDWKEPLSCFEPEAEDSDGDKEIKEPQSSFKTLGDKITFSCSLCGKMFGSTQYLQRHMRCHTEPKTFLCSFCGKKFTKNSNLTTHLRVHTGEKPFTCSVCNTSFSLRCTLVTHMRIHTGEKPFSCFLCGKRFAKKANLKVHMAVHTEEKAYSCSVCNKRFTWHSQVKSHKCVGVSSSSQ